MLKKIFLPTIFLALAYGFWYSPNFKEIAAGVSIFLFGMLFLEQGFSAFSGGILENILKKSTDKVYKSLSFGVIATSIMQSSSLVSVITISFISAGLIGLSEGIGIVFGANIGTTTGAWLIAGFGLKVKISAYAMPMIVFGIILVFQKTKSLKGFGYILAGLGFLFLGIHYMKDGFEAFKETIDLSTLAVSGYLGLFIFTGVGMFATVVMQSSHATLVLILTALAAGQITYENALALSIGANVGTTITAIIGSMSSNVQGKRLAAAHLIFNLITALIAMVFIYPLMDIVDLTSEFLGISQNDWTLKLAVFHTYFNVIGVIIMTPMIPILVKLLNKILKEPVEIFSHSKPKYLNDDVQEFPIAAIAALKKECDNLYEHSFEVLAHAINLNRTDIRSYKPMSEVVKSSTNNMTLNIDELYKTKVKSLYDAIVEFSTKAQVNMTPEEIKRTYELQTAARDVINAVKGMKELEHNIHKYSAHSNNVIKEEYNLLRELLGKLLRKVEQIRQNPNEEDLLFKFVLVRKNIEDFDEQINQTVDELIRNNKISASMASSLMNDSGYLHNIGINIIGFIEILYIKENETLSIMYDELISEDLED